MTSARQTHLVRTLSVTVLIFTAPVVWLTLQQGVGTLNYFNCHAAAPPWGVLIGIVATVACVSAASLCWRRRNQGRPTERFLMQVGAGASAIFALTALTMTAALILIPSCAR